MRADPPFVGPQLGAGGKDREALRDLLPRDEDMPSARPSVSLSQFFVAAHKEIDRLEEANRVLPAIDVEAEPILALPGLTDTRDGAGGGAPATNASHGAAPRSSAQVQSETA